MKSPEEIPCLLPILNQKQLRSAGDDELCLLDGFAQVALFFLNLSAHEARVAVGTDDSGMH